MSREDESGAPGRPGERLPSEQVREQARAAEENPIVRALLEAVDGLLVVLNPNLQILAANQKMLAGRPPECLLGVRMGEAFQCIHATETPGGCGASPACLQCGALQTILRARSEGRTAEGECLLTTGEGAAQHSLELNVRATPVACSGCPYLVVSLRDISDEKRREALEQIFFHDVLNTLNALTGWSRALEKAEGERSRQIAERIATLTRRLVGEVRGQRTLTLAERGELELDQEELSVGELLAEIALLFSHHPAARARALEVSPVYPQLVISSDFGLLLRVLANMVTNALEATGPGGVVQVRANVGPASICFEVHNSGAIPEPVRLRIFQRSFSTKPGKGRGLGTYGMKLFGERYLGGRVWFESSEAGGTSFFLELTR